MAEETGEILEESVGKTLEDIGIDTLDDGANANIADQANSMYEEYAGTANSLTKQEAVMEATKNVLKESGDLANNVSKDTLQTLVDDSAQQAVEDAEKTAVKREPVPYSKQALKYGSRVLQGALVVGFSATLLTMAFEKPKTDVGGSCVIRAKDENDCSAIGTYLGATAATYDKKKSMCKISGGYVTEDACKNVRKTSYVDGLCKVTGSMIVDDRVCFDAEKPCIPSNLSCKTCKSKSKCPTGTKCRNRVCEHLRYIAADGKMTKKPMVQATYAKKTCNLINVTKAQCDALGLKEVNYVCKYGSNPRTLIPCKHDKECTASKDGKCVSSYTKGNKNPMAGCLVPGGDCPPTVSPEARYGTMTWIVIAFLVIVVIIFFVVRRVRKKA